MQNLLKYLCRLSRVSRRKRSLQNVQVNCFVLERTRYKAQAKINEIELVGAISRLLQQHVRRSQIAMNDLVAMQHADDAADLAGHLVELFVRAHRFAIGHRLLDEVLAHLSSLNELHDNDAILFVALEHFGHVDAERRGLVEQFHLVSNAFYCQRFVQFRMAIGFLEALLGDRRLSIVEQTLVDARLSALFDQLEIF